MRGSLGVGGPRGLQSGGVRGGDVTWSSALPFMTMQNLFSIISLSLHSLRTWTIMRAG
jgi:hypothetical protein